jgi:hypothetical protein
MFVETNVFICYSCELQDIAFFYFLSDVFLMIRSERYQGELYADQRKSSTTPVFAFLRKIIYPHTKH